MKSFSLRFTGSRMRTGLRKDFRKPRNTLGLIECQNMKVGEHGLYPYEPPTIPISIDQLVGYELGLNWPYPQLLRGSEFTFLCHRQNIFLVDEEEWLLYPLEIFDIDNPTVEKYPTPGGLWQLADFGDTWLLTNGFSSVWHHGRHTMLGEEDKVYCQSYARFQTACNYDRSRMIIGGMDSEYFWNSAWTSFIQNLAGQLNSRINTDIALDENFVMWSPIGSDLFWMFEFTLSMNSLLDQAGESEYDSSDSYFMDLMLRNDMGWMPMSWRGVVNHVKQLGRNFISYGDNGVTALVPMTTPTPGFGKVEVLPHGILGAGSIGGDENMHVFIDQRGDLWSLDKELNKQQLGYREFFDPSLDTQWVVSHDSYNNEFYLCNGLETFLLTRHGLSKPKQIITSIMYRGGNVLCLGSDLTDNAVLFTTDEFDLGMSGLPTIQWVHIGGNMTYDYEVAIDYKFEDNEDFSRTGWAPVNSVGVANLPTAGRSFRVAIRATGLDEPDEVQPPDWIDVVYQVSDRRFRRSIDVSQINTE